MATARLFLWTAARGGWASCGEDEITWLDRGTLSGGKDLTLHRAPRCAGLRYIEHRWELFSRDTTHPVYLAPDTTSPDTEGPEAAQTPLNAAAVQRAARHVLPVTMARYEALPVELEAGRWLVGVGDWVARLRLEVPARPPADRAPPNGGKEEITREAAVTRRGGAPSEEAVARVRGYFERNSTARLTMAYYYQEFVLGLAAPQPVPMMDVAVALDLSGEGAVSDYKKLLQGFVWNERGHSRDLADFLLGNDLLSATDVHEARQLAADNERGGICEAARRRLRYRPKGT